MLDPRRLGVAAVLVALATAAPLAPATAMVEWSPGVPVTAGAVGSFAETAVDLVTDADGDAWVLVGDSDGLVLAEHPADGGDPTVQVVDESGRDGSLVIDPDGRITAVYARYGESTSVVARPVTPDGTIGPAQVVSATDYRNEAPSAAVSPDGTVTVVWVEYADSDARTMRLQAARLAADTAVPLAPPTTLDEPRTRMGYTPLVATDLLGRATVAWVRQSLAGWGDAAPPGLHAVRLDAVGQPGSVQRVSPEGVPPYAGVGEIVIGRAGAATIVWTADTEPRRSTWAARLPADGGAVVRRTRLSEPDEGSVGAPTAAIDPRGRVTVVWGRNGSGGVHRLESRRLAADGRPQERRPELGWLDRGGPRQVVGVVADSRSNVTVVWPARDATTYATYQSRIHSVRIGARGRIGSERRLSRDLGLHYYTLGVSLTPDDRVVATWIETGGARIARSAPADAARVPADTDFLIRPSATTTERRPLFRFWSAAVAASFACRIDGGRWRPCAWQMRPPRLSYGAHRLAVRATDVDGTPTDPTPAVAEFKVVRPE